MIQTLKAMRLSQTVTKAALLSTGLLCCLTACSGLQPAPEQMTVQGELHHYPSHVKSSEAWYGHPFKVDNTPVLPSEHLSEADLKQYVGKRVRIQGVWYAGEEWHPSKEELNTSMPVDPQSDEKIIRGDGLKAHTLEVLD